MREENQVARPTVIEDITNPPARLLAEKQRRRGFSAAFKTHDRFL